MTRDIIYDKRTRFFEQQTVHHDTGNKKLVDVTCPYILELHVDDVLWR